MKKETRQRIEEIFIAYDGKEFRTEHECEDHESLLKEEERLKSAEPFLASDINAFLVGGRNIYRENYQYDTLWYKVTNDEELAIICDAYRTYSRDFKSPEKVKNHLTYPDYLCIIDDRNATFTKWFSLSEMEERILEVKNAIKAPTEEKRFLAFTTYSFDADVPSKRFYTEEEATQYIKMDSLREREIEIKEAGKELGTDLFYETSDTCITLTTIDKDGKKDRMTWYVIELPN